MKWFALVVVALAFVLGLAVPGMATPGQMIFTGCNPMWESPGLFLSDPDGNEPVRLLRNEGGWSCARSADWTADGLKVVMSYNDGEGCKLVVMETCCLAPSVVWNRPLQVIHDCGTRAKWSPAGDRIAFLSGDGLALINPDGSNYRVLDSNLTGVLNWSPDGSTIILGTNGWGAKPIGDLYLVTDLDNPGGVSITQLTNTPDTAENNPAISPNGMEIAYTLGPSVAPEWNWEDSLPAAGIRVADYPSLTNERILTDDPNYHDRVAAWMPDGSYIYFVREEVGLNPRASTIWRIKADGSAPAEQVPGLSDWYISMGVDFLEKAVYTTSRYTLPGYTNVPIDIGIVGAENLAGVQADLNYGDCCNLIGSVDSFTTGAMISDWAVAGPIIDNNAYTARCLAYASDPGTQMVSGLGELFNLTASMRMYEDLQLIGGVGLSPIWFNELALSDDWGEPIEMAKLNGALAFKPFASLEVAGVPGVVWADSVDPEPFNVMITALGEESELLPWVNRSVDLFIEKPDQWGYPAMFRDVTPTSVALATGVWTGDVSVLVPAPPSAKLVARYQDWGGKSGEFSSIAKGDVNSDGSVSIFDVVKVANMAIDRGAWEAWQRWAGDLNGDGEVNIFDVVICAARAMEQMQNLSAGRGTATAIAPADSVTVTTLLSKTDAPTTLTVVLSDSAGLAGLQVEVAYDASRLKLAGVAPGALLAGKSTWSIASNDKGGTVKAIAYSPTADVLTGGQGSVFTFTFDKLGKKSATPTLTSVRLSAAEGVEIESQLSDGRGRKQK